MSENSLAVVLVVRAAEFEPSQSVCVATLVRASKFEPLEEG